MNRRDFFKRTGSTAVALAIVATPLSLFAQKPKVNGRLRVDGKEVELSDAAVAKGIEIHATGPVSITNCIFNAPGDVPAILVGSA